VVARAMRCPPATAIVSTTITTNRVAPTLPRSMNALDPSEPMVNAKPQTAMLAARSSTNPRIGLRPNSPRITRMLRCHEPKY
jgi:hypothetical protein